MDTPLFELGLSYRLLDMLHNNGFSSAGDVIEFSRADLGFYRCFGENHYIELDSALARLGLRLPDESAPWVRRAIREGSYERLAQGLRRRRIGEGK